MKRTVIRRTLTVFAFAFSSQFIFVENALGQNLKENNINYVAKDATINNVFKQLNKLTGFYFFYNESVLKDLRTVNIQIQKGSIEDILKSLSQQTGLYFKRINNTISVSKTPEPESNNSTQQRKRLTGVITDSNGETIIGANISVKGSTLGTITDVNGNFSLEVPNSGMLTISYIGYISKNVPITNENNISITLTEDTQKLDEVVVVGYGVVRKSDLTGSVGSVKANIIESMPIARVDQALQGRVSGVQITTSNGAPGASTTIRIRGGNSINAGNEPLYVIDGIIGGGDLNTINPADIESIEVLKDASSTAIYGSRGVWGIERSGFFNGREKWAKGFENQRV
ncbi:STN domain-containing protein [Phocaeicola massiliensis]